MTGERNPNRTPVEVEERVVALARQGKSAPEISEVTRVKVGTVRAIVRRTPGVEWGRAFSPPAGTPGAAAVARGYRSAYQRTKREETATRLLDQMVRTAILLEGNMPPRERQALSQSLDALTRAYANITKNDVEASEQEQMQKTLSMFGIMMERLREQPNDDLPVAVRPDGTTVTHLALGGSIER
ncbi:hypothetical protein MRBLWH7_000335 [Microbacterium sp. LWH7-1.2]|uniref:hypothetical protein n=1 Tax=Microbacterium sp. LWH7-1.2 TaxID=3135257 RepID=UPI0031387714